VKSLPAVILVCLLALPTVAQAAAPTAADSEAKQHFERGTSAYALGDYSEAATEYERAFKLKPDAALLYNAAQAHRLAGHKERALQLYESYLNVFGAQIKNREDVTRLVLNLRHSIEADRSSLSAPPTSMATPHGDTPAPTAPPATAPPAASETSSEATPAVVATAPAPRPLVKRAWFWGVVGGAAVVVAAGITLGVVLGGPKDPKGTFGSVAGN
jgi:hypothetical protein